MLGRKTFEPKLFYQVSLEERVPEDHLLRRVAAAADFGFVRRLTARFYSHTGRPGVDRGRSMAALRRYHDLRWWLPVHDLVALVVRELRLVELTAELRRPRDHWRRLRFLVGVIRFLSCRLDWIFRCCFCWWLFAPRRWRPDSVAGPLI